MSKTLTWSLEPRPTGPARWARRLAAGTLRRIGQGLDAWAHRLALPEPAPVGEPQLEFHREAGAPEGALYVDGRRVGVLPGVTRL